ncbi:MAG: Ig-like domain-containing protein, partial [Proteobacteria bacterium]|nr:Ig-like domain-containing protein [Pseudomonadota bacterium]
MKKSLLFCFFLFMVAFGLTSCVEPNKESDFKGQQTFVSVRVKLNGPPNRSFNNNPGNFKISTLPENTETALIVAVSAETDFKDGYNQIDPFFDKNLLDLDDSTVVLELPLNTPIRLFEYTFNQAFSLAELAESDRLVISSSVVDTFTLTEATTTLELYSSLGIAASPESIVISPASTNLKVGQTKQYSATAYYKEGNPQDLTALLNWSSSDSSLAEITDSVDSKGLATGKGSGIIVITATDGKVTAESALMVGSRPTAAPNTVSTNEDVDRIFAAGDFNFTDEDSGDTLSGVVITTLENNGRLYLDANSNGQVDAGEEIETNQEIPANDLSKLKLKPGVDVSGASYATFNFKVFDGVFYSTDDYAMTVDVAAVDDLPFISTIPDREIWGPVQPFLVSFTMSDAETDSNSLTLAGVSSNQTLLPDAGIAFSGTGTSRSATIS